MKSPSKDREGQGSATAAGEGQEAPGTQGTPHPQPEGSRKRYRSYSGHTASSPKKQAPLQTDMGRLCCVILFACFQKKNAEILIHVL